MLFVYNYYHKNCRGGETWLIHKRDRLFKNKILENVITLLDFTFIFAIKTRFKIHTICPLNIHFDGLD